MIEYNFLMVAAVYWDCFSSAMHELLLEKTVFNASPYLGNLFLLGNFDLYI